MEQFVEVKPISHGNTLVRLASDSDRLFVVTRIEVPGRVALAAAQKEARILVALRHGTILPVREAIVESDSLCIVTEYAAGGNLEGVLRSVGGRLPVADIRRCAVVLTAALEYLHGRGVCHGFLQPSAVLLGDAGELLLGGFGMARILGSAAAVSAAESSYAWAPPELLVTQTVSAGRRASDNNVKPDARADVWSFGAILFQLVSGSLLPSPATLPSGSPWVLPPLPPSTDADIARLIRAALILDPAIRPTMAELSAGAPMRAIRAAEGPPPLVSLMKHQDSEMRAAQAALLKVQVELLGVQREAEGLKGSLAAAHEATFAAQGVATQAVEERTAADAKIRELQEGLLEAAVAHRGLASETESLRQELGFANSNAAQATAMASRAKIECAAAISAAEETRAALQEARSAEAAARGATQAIIDRAVNVAIEGAKSLSSELETARAQITQLTHELQRCSDELTASAALREVVAQDLSRARDTSKEVVAENARLRSELAASIAAAGSQEAINRALQSDLAEMRARIAAQESEHAAHVQRAVAKSEAAIVELMTELTVTRASLLSAETAVTEAKSVACAAQCAESAAQAIADAAIAAKNAAVAAAAESDTLVRIARAERHAAEVAAQGVAAAAVERVAAQAQLFETRARQIEADAAADAENRMRVAAQELEDARAEIQHIQGMLDFSTQELADALIEASTARTALERCADGHAAVLKAERRAFEAVSAELAELQQQVSSAAARAEERRIKEDVERTCAEVERAAMERGRQEALLSADLIAASVRQLEENRKRLMDTHLDI